MEAIKHISVDLSEKHNVPVIYAVQGDAYLRKIKISLFNNGTAFEIDSLYDVFFAYKKSDGHGGVYDRLEDGSSAFELDYEPNNITVTLADQVLNVPGYVTASISFVKEGRVLSTFPLVIDVSEQPGIDVAESKDYFVLGAAVDAVIAAAKKPVHIVEVYFDDDTSSYVKNYSFADMMGIIGSQSPIVCKWYEEDVILQMVQHRADVVVVFACVLDNTEYKVAIYANERVSVSKNVISSGGNGEGGGDSVSDAVRYTPQELTEEQKAQARQNIGACDPGYVDDAISNIKLPAGGEGGNNAFCFSLILDEDKDIVPIEFPVNWDKIIQYNIHIEMNLTADMAWTTQVGNSWSPRDAFSAGTKGHNIYGIRYMHYGDIGWLFMEGRSTATNSSDTARPTIGQKAVGAMSHSNTYVFYSTTEGVMFPAGTRFDVWGVYAP